MIRRSDACKYVRTSSRVFKINQTSFEELSLVMRYFWVWAGNKSPEQPVEISNVTEVEESKTVKVKSQSHFDRVLRLEGHRPQPVLATGPDDQSANLQGVCEREEPSVVAGQIVAISSRQCTCSHCYKHPVVSGWEEYRRTRTISVHPILAPCDFSFL